MVEVTFSGGPRDGQMLEFIKDPRVVACVTEADAKGMHGVYRTQHGADGIIAIWKEVKHDCRTDKATV